MARILFRACRSQVRHYLAKSTACMLLSTGPSMKSGLLNFPLVKTLPSPREHNRKMVASQHWCWSLEPPLQALVPLQLVRLWGPILAVLYQQAQSLLPWSPSCRCLVYLRFSTGTEVHGEMHWANVQTSTTQYSGMSVFTYVRWLYCCMSPF
jgi:hypothetical protein